MYKLLNEYCDGALRGDEVAIMDLLEALRPLMEQMISSMFPRTTEREDLLSEAQCVLLECLTTYDPSRGVRFVGYYRTQLRYYFLKRIESNMTLPIPVLDIVSETGVSGLENLTTEETAEDEFMAKEARAALDGALAKLSVRERQVIELFYDYDLSLSEIGGFLGISYQSVANTKSRGLKKLASLLEEGLYDGE